MDQLPPTETGLPPGDEISRYDPPPTSGVPEKPSSWGAGTLESHITILGALYIAFSALGVLLALGLSLAIIGGGILSGDAEARTITGLVGSCLGGLLLVISLPGLLGGIYLLRRRRWARILVLVLGFVNLLNVPIGTALGVYTIWALLQPDADEIFH